MKYVLFNKKQLAVFNLIEDPFYPLGENCKKSKLTEKMKFEMDINLIKEKALEFLKEDENEIKKEAFSRRLYKLLDQP